jgi:succinate dehydrogenase / fumarate reductase membrane anchor subunit
LFLIAAFSFFSLTISEVFEDYIKNEKIKNVATKMLYVFAIVIPLITILSILSLN